MSKLFETHDATVQAALRAITTREYWTAYSESPSPRAYGEGAKERAAEQIESMKGNRFELVDHPVSDWLGDETSPFGESVGISYPACQVRNYISASDVARRDWAVASVEERIGVCLEILHRLNRQSHLIAHACRLTTGQPFLMAFQAGGPHAQERGLEAVVHAYDEMRRIPRSVHWVKPQGKAEALNVDKTFRIIPRGISVAIACATFPTWNTYSGAFASLATGNTVIVKPHSSSVLPLAITVKIMREVLVEEGFNPNVVLLASDTAAAPVAKELVMHREVKIVDFTGSPAFGEWLRTHVRHAQVYTEEAGVNSIVIDSTHDFTGMCRNIAFSLALYSGQMCTAPQNLLVSRTGIETNEGHKGFADVAQGICDALQSLLSDPTRAEGILGAIQSEDTLKRVVRAGAEGPVLMQSKPIRYAGYPHARTATPLVRRADASERALFMEEKFGPISYIIETDSVAGSMRLAQEAALDMGAISMGVYSTSRNVVHMAEEVAMRSGVNLSSNLTGSNYFLNQNAAFSDYHVSGANPAGNACITDAAFVANRFRVVGSRCPDYGHALNLVPEVEAVDSVNNPE